MFSTLDCIIVESQFQMAFPSIPEILLGEISLKHCLQKTIQSQIFPHNDLVIYISQYIKYCDVITVIVDKCLYIAQPYIHGREDHVYLELPVA